MHQSLILALWATASCAVAQQAASPDEAAGAARARALVDSVGDRVPRGAVARIGHNRFRHTGDVFGITKSKDEQVVVTFSDDGHVYLWNASDGRQLSKLPVPEDYPTIDEVAISPDRKNLAMVCLAERFKEPDEFHYESSVYLFKLGLSKEGVFLQGTSTIDGSRRRRCRFLSFSADGSTVIYGNQGVVRGWSVEDSKPTFRVELPRVLAYCPATDHVAVDHGIADEVSIWSLKEAKEIIRWKLPTVEGANATPWHAEFSPTGKYVAIDGRWTSSVTEVATGKTILVNNIENRRIFSFSSDERLYAESGPNGVVCWDLINPKAPFRAWQDDNAVAYGAVFLGNNRKLAYACGQVCRLVDIDTGAHLLPEQYQFVLRKLAFSPDGTSVLTSEPRLIETATGKQKWRVDAPYQYSEVFSFRYPDAVVTASSFSNELRVFNAATGRLNRSVDLLDAIDVSTTEVGRARDREQLLGTPSFSPDGRLLFVPFGSAVVVVDTITGKQINVFNPKLGRVQRVVGSPDNRICAAFIQDSGGSAKTHLFFWNHQAANDTNSVIEIERASSRRAFSRGAFSAGGHYFIRYCGEPVEFDDSLQAPDRNRLEIWETASAQRLHRVELGGDNVGDFHFVNSDEYALMGAWTAGGLGSSMGSITLPPRLLDLASGRLFICRRLPASRIIEMSSDGKRVIIDDKDNLAPIIYLAPSFDLKGKRASRASKLTVAAAWDALGSDAKTAALAVTAVAEFDKNRLGELHKRLRVEDVEFATELARLAELVKQLAVSEPGEADRLYNLLFRLELRQPRIARPAIAELPKTIGTNIAERLDRDLSSPLLRDESELRRLRLVRALALNASKEARAMALEIGDATPDSPAGRTVVAMRAYFETK